MINNSTVLCLFFCQQLEQLMVKKKNSQSNCGITKDVLHACRYHWQSMYLIWVSNNVHPPPICVKWTCSEKAQKAKKIIKPALYWSSCNTPTVLRIQPHRHLSNRSFAGLYHLSFIQTKPPPVDPCQDSWNDRVPKCVIRVQQKLSHSYFHNIE